MNDFLEPNREITSINNDASAKAADGMLHHHINNAPTKNRKRKCEEFTISQKLSILNELRTKKCSVPSLAQKHNTSRTTIYRWKKEEPRLNRLKRSNANSKRVSLSATTSSSSLSSRKTYNDEFTAEQKLEVLKECADNPMVPMKEIATRYGTHVRSVYRWRKDEERLRLLVEEDKAHMKRLPKDGLHRVKSAIVQYFSDQKVSGVEIARKAKEVRDELLGEHEISPFLNEAEFRALRDFTASSSWGRKLVRKFGWKEGVTGRVIEEGEGTEGGFDQQLEQQSQMQQPMQPHWNTGQPSQLTLRLQQPIIQPLQEGPLTEKEGKQVKLEKEILALKRKIKRLENKNEKLERENGWLKRRLAGADAKEEQVTNSGPSQQQVMNQCTEPSQPAASLLPQSVQEGDDVDEVIAPYLG